MSLAFEITNRLLNEDCIVAGVSAERTQRYIQEELGQDPRFRALVVHLLSEASGDPEPHCHQVGKCALSSERRIVNCQKCLAMDPDRWEA